MPRYKGIVSTELFGVLLRSQGYHRQPLIEPLVSRSTEVLGFETHGDHSALSRSLLTCKWDVDRYLERERLTAAAIPALPSLAAAFTSSVACIYEHLDRSTYRNDSLTAAAALELALVPYEV